MNFAKRAVSSVTRRKGKSIILFAVIFILGNVIAGAISTQQATENVEKNIKSQLGGKATISFDDTAYQKDNKNGSEESDIGMPTIKDIEKIGSLSYVKYYDYNAVDYAGTNKLISYSPPDESGDSNSFSNGFGTKYQFNFYGVNYPKVLDIQEKKIELIDGRVFTQEEIDKGSSVAIISKNVAEANNLHVGDTLVVDKTEVESDDSGNPTDNKIEMNFAFEIIGIFNPLELPQKEKNENQAQSFGIDQSYEEKEKQNRIYSTNKVVTKNSINFMKESIKKFPDQYTYQDEKGNEVKYEVPEDENEQSYNSVFILKSPEDVEAFKQEAQPLLPKYYKILASSDQYDSIAGPVKSMSKMSKYVLIVALGATLLIITLVVLLFLRDRKHELGVYL